MPVHRTRMAALIAALLVATSLATAGVAIAATPTLTVTPTTTAITVGDATNATADISGYDTNGDGSGGLTIALFSDASCTSELTSEAFGTVNADGRFGPLTTPYTTTATGAVYWQAHYAGDDLNDEVWSACAEVTVGRAAPTLTISPDLTPIVVGDETNADATLSGGYSPTGTVTIGLFSNSTCDSATLATEGFTVTDNGAFGPLTTAYTTSAAGSVWWQAGYDGDGNNDPATSTCEQVVVDKAEVTLTTAQSPTTVDPAPADLADTATLAGGYNPTGTITFALFPPGDATCAGIPAYTEDVAVDGGNNDYSIDGHGTGSISAALAGVWNWTADYSGDENNETASSGCGAEEVEVHVDTRVVYAGQTYDSDLGGTTVLSARLTSIDPVCLSGDATFTLTPVGGTPQAPVVVVNVSPGSFAGTTRALAAGIYEVDVDFTPTDPFCNPSSDAAVLTVVGTGASSTGGGWYRVDSFSPPRINFGYTIQKQVNRKTQVATYRGQLLWMNNGTWRLKGTMYSTGSDPAAYGRFPCPAFVGVPGASNPMCGSFSGSGVLQAWDPTADGGAGAWANSTYGTVAFTATVYDGGSMKVCKGKRNCTKQDLADWFGIQINPVPGTVVPESAPIKLRGGSLKVS